MKGLLLGLLIAAPCALAGWTELSDGRLTSSVGDNKIVRIDNVIIFWQKIDFKEGESPIDQLLIRVVASCESYRYSVLHKSSYKLGKEIFKSDDPDEIKTIEQGSLLANSVDFICQPKSTDLILNSPDEREIY